MKLAQQTALPLKLPITGEAWLGMPVATWRPQSYWKCSEPEQLCWGSVAMRERTELPDSQLQLPLCAGHHVRLPFWQGVRQLMANPEALPFFAMSLLMGFAVGLLSTYLFLYLDELSEYICQLLLGQCEWPSCKCLPVQCMTAATVAQRSMAAGLHGSDPSLDVGLGLCKAKLGTSLRCAAV